MSDYRDYGFPGEESTHAHAYLQQPLVQLLNKDLKPCILDLGCGNGSLVRFLLNKGFDAYGTDASEEGIRIAKNLHPDRFALQDLSTDDLPSLLADISFNTIISTEVIEHLYNPRKFITFCKTILIKSGGDLIISTPYHGYLKNLSLSLIGYWDKHLDPLWDGGHIKMWSKNTLTLLLEEQGFKVSNFIGCGRYPYLWKSMMIKATLAHA